MAIEFREDDSSYLHWLTDNPDGLVLNTRRRDDPTYMVLHRARCRSISRYASNARHGAFTEPAYVKVCAGNLDELRKWVGRNGRPDGGFSGECGLCRPL